MKMVGLKVDKAAMGKLVAFVLVLALLLTGALFPVFPDRPNGEPVLKGEELASVALVAISISAVLGLYLFASRFREATKGFRPFLIAAAVVGWTAGARLLMDVLLPDEEGRFLAYLLPIAAVPIMIAALLDATLSVAVAALIALLATYAGFYAPDAQGLSLNTASNPLAVFAVYFVGSLAGIYVIFRSERFGRYLVAGAMVALTSLSTALGFWLMAAGRESVDVLWIVLATAINGALSALLAACGALVLPAVFGVTSRSHLMELAQLQHPLLRRLQAEAPGTFHHSMEVSNLAERAAEAIGADALLARVGAYFHDIGKLVHPRFYIENQADMANPHDDLDSYTSAEKIIEHVQHGEELARTHILPPAVAQFVVQHHGSRLVTYFYRKAMERDIAVDTTRFAYPGPKPQSRESGIVMLADSVEALVRSSEDRSSDRIDSLVENVIAERVAEGQLDESNLTLGDLRGIAVALKATLKAIYHQRVTYPAPMAFEAERTAAAARYLRAPVMPMDGMAEPSGERQGARSGLDST